MQDVLLVVLGAAAGGGAVWLWMSRRMHDVLRGELAAAARKTARAVELTRDEVGAQIERRDRELATLRERVNEEHHAAEEGQSRLRANLDLVRQERVHLEARATDLTEKVDALNAQLRGATDEGLRELERLREITRTLEQVLATYTGTIEHMEARLAAAAGRVRQLIS